MTGRRLGLGLDEKTIEAVKEIKGQVGIQKRETRRGDRANRSEFPAVEVVSQFTLVSVLWIGNANKCSQPDLHPGSEQSGPLIRDWSRSNESALAAPVNVATSYSEDWDQ